MEFSIFGLLNSPEFQLLISMFLVPLAVNSVSERLKALKAAIKDKPHEKQLLDCLERAFYETERALHRKHNTEAIYETFMGSLMSFSSTFNKDSLAKIFKDAIGEDVTDDEISLWIDNLFKQISLPEHEVLYRYLILKKILVFPKGRQQENLEYLLTYTTPVWDNKDVICRDDIIQDLFAKFSTGVRRIQVAGMGGLGKTEILVKLFFQLNQPNPPVHFDYIGFIQFKDDLESDFRLHIPYLAEYAKNHGEAAAKLILQQLCSTNRVLFCIDDDRDKKDILKKNDPNIAFLKTLNASILFASRTEYAEFEQQELPLLPTVACIDIFQRTYGKNIHNAKDLEILTKIIEELSGNNTLIVNRLGNMANENTFTIEQLQISLQDKGFHIKKGCIDEEELQQEISKLYPISEIIRSGDKSIVEAFSVFPVTPLPIDLCVDWLHEDAGIDVEECSLALTRLSKQTWLEKRINTSDGVVLFSMHQCVKSAVKDQTPVECSAHQKLIEGCNNDVNKFTNDYNLQKSSLLIPFAVSAFNNLFHETSQHAKLSDAIANYYNKSADYTSALDWYQKTLSICENALGNDHPSTAITYNNIAAVYDSQGQYSLALEWYQKALPFFQSVLCEDHAFTAAIYNNIAGVYDNQGQYDLALQWYQKALPIVQRELGEDHPYTATTYNNIASIYNYKGQYDRALQWHNKALDILEKVLGKDHPDTASSYNNIAMVYINQGKYALALEWYQKALAIREKVLGKDHQMTGSTYNNIAGVYKNLGLYDLALEWSFKDLAISEKVLGKEHPDTAIAYSNIASVYYSQGKYDLALEWHQKDLVISEKVLGKDHPSTAITYNNIAVVYAHQGQYNLALEWYQNALTIYNKVLGEDHPNTIIIKENISHLENMA